MKRAVLDGLKCWEVRFKTAKNLSRIEVDCLYAMTETDARAAMLRGWSKAQYPTFHLLSVREVASPHHIGGGRGDYHRGSILLVSCAGGTRERIVQVTEYTSNLDDRGNAGWRGIVIDANSCEYGQFVWGYDVYVLEVISE